MRANPRCFKAFGAKNANTLEWETLANSPHEGFQGLWPMEWPQVGVGINPIVTLEKQLLDMTVDLV
jgi:hypothetical protein